MLEAGSQVLPFSILRRTVWFGLVWVYSIFSKKKQNPPISGQA
jgi:hypothetical protein